jgi:hypothetical protein
VASKHQLNPKYELRIRHMPEKELGGVGQDEEFASEQSDGTEMGILHRSAGTRREISHSARTATDRGRRILAF